MQNKQITIPQQGAGVWLRELPPAVRLTIGLISCGIVGYYVLIVIIAATGRWITSLTDPVGLAIATVILVVQNMIGRKLKRVVLFGLIAALVFDGISLYVELSTHRHWSFYYRWNDFFLPTVACTLSAWLFQKYENATKG